jgi:hypothetical protein
MTPVHNNESDTLLFCVLSLQRPLDMQGWGYLRSCNTALEFCTLNDIK